jgi:O-methyltransferase
MPVGGLVVYDDYGFPRCDGITRHVDEQRTLADRVVIHNLNGHAVVLKTAG